MKKISPALFLFILAPICGELLSGSAPPVEFFKPLTLITLCLLYGGGAVLVRETAFRWGKGWLSILILGAAYGIIEEGLMVKSFFDPGWMDLGILGIYGRWLGVNWVWTMELIIYHSIFSIGVPILITTLVFPSHQSEAWVSRRWLTWIFILFMMDILFGFLALTTYRPPAIHYILAIAVTIGLIWLAKRIPEPVAGYFSHKPTSPGWFVLAAFIATMLFFITAWALPTLSISPIIPILMLILLPLGGGVLIWRMTGRGNGSPVQLGFLASGALLFFIMLAPLSEQDQTRMDDPSGMSLVALVGLILLIAFNWRMIRQEKLTTG